MFACPRNQLPRDRNESRNRSTKWLVSCPGFEPTSAPAKSMILVVCVPPQPISDRFLQTEFRTFLNKSCPKFEPRPPHGEWLSLVGSGPPLPLLPCKKTPGTPVSGGIFAPRRRGRPSPGGPRPCCPAGGQGQVTPASAASPDTRARQLSSSDGDCLRQANFFSSLRCGAG